MIVGIKQKIGETKKTLPALSVRRPCVALPSVPQISRNLDEDERARAAAKFGQIGNVYVASNQIDTAFIGRLYQFFQNYLLGLRISFSSGKSFYF
jgi:hypothetical protein